MICINSFKNSYLFQHKNILLSILYNHFSKTLISVILKNKFACKKKYYIIYKNIVATIKIYASSHNLMWVI